MGIHKFLFQLQAATYPTPTKIGSTLTIFALGDERTKGAGLPAVRGSERPAAAATEGNLSRQQLLVSPSVEVQSCYSRVYSVLAASGYTIQEGCGPSREISPFTGLSDGESLM
ncbi:hypothetical protein OPV22_011813 [Ensete ventricosum]|uniref:Uncharacterized protein n=1 Tax=Ensete ventricosum TaxID=4639 RepID=A0AAV8RKH5_ENSVE|nr:hypothetical protein OPV22_011813 [Ensete ventricosum]